MPRKKKPPAGGAASAAAAAAIDRIAQGILDRANASGQGGGNVTQGKNTRRGGPSPGVTHGTKVNAPGKDKPIGVRPGFGSPAHPDYGQQSTNTRGRHVTASTNPIYFAGDEMVPGNLSPEAVYQIQMQMVAAGLLDPKKMKLGQWEGATIGAFKNLLGQSNRQGVVWSQMLDTLSSLPQNDSGTGTKNPPLTISLTHPDQINAAADKVAPDLLGRKLSDAEKADMVGQFHNEQTQAQTQAYNQQYTPDSQGGGYGAGGTTVDPGNDPSAYLDQAIKKKYKTETDSNSLGQNALLFLQMLSKGAPDVGLPGYQS